MKKKTAMVVGLVLVLVLIGAQFAQIRGLRASVDDVNYGVRGLQQQLDRLEDDVWFYNLTDSEKAECMVTGEEFAEMYAGYYYTSAFYPNPRFVYYDAGTGEFYWKPAYYVTLETLPDTDVGVRPWSGLDPDEAPYRFRK